MRNNKNKIKPIISIGEMAKALGHSRARFYQLQNQKIYPMPLYDIRTKRPFFDARLQNTCQEVRETGIGYNGQFILFYSPRKTSTTKVQRSCRAKGQSKDIPAEQQELVDTLNQMGVEVSGEQIFEVVEKLYPDGLENKNMGLVVREIFCHFRKSM